MSPSAGTAGERVEPEIELEFPARPEFVRTARHTVVALVRMLNVNDDVADDVRVAVSEAVTTAIQADHQADRRVSLSAWADTDRLRVEVEAPGPGLARAVEGDPGEIDTADLPFESALSVPIIRGLAEEVFATPTDGGSRIGITLSLSSPDEASQGV